MRKNIITCFRYKKYNDIYISNMFFSADILLSILNVFTNNKFIILIDSDKKSIQTVSSTGKSFGIAQVGSNSPVPRFTAICDKIELQLLFNQVNINEFDGMFIASIINDIIPNKLISSLANKANSLVQDGISDLSFFINFPENQMIITFSKEKHELMSIKNKIRCILGE